MEGKVKIDRSVWKQHAGNTTLRKNVVWKKKKEMAMPL
jgi:hypothetical protein